MGSGLKVSDVGDLGVQGSRLDGLRFTLGFKLRPDRKGGRSACRSSLHSEGC